MGMETGMETAMAAHREEATTKTEQPFQRGRHLALALLGLAHAPVSGITGAALVWATSTRYWSAELATANAMLWLCLAAFVGWLAFAVFDTNAGVTIWPKRWRDIGVLLAAWCVSRSSTCWWASGFTPMSTRQGPSPHSSSLASYGLAGWP